MSLLDLPVMRTTTTLGRLGSSSGNPPQLAFPPPYLRKSCSASLSRSKLTYIGCLRACGHSLGAGAGGADDRPPPKEYGMNGLTKHAWQMKQPMFCETPCTKPCWETGLMDNQSVNDVMFNPVLGLGFAFATKQGNTQRVQP
jgi:hypothetical protein